MTAVPGHEGTSHRQRGCRLSLPYELSSIKSYGEWDIPLPTALHRQETKKEEEHIEPRQDMRVLDLLFHTRIIGEAVVVCITKA